ncbi:MAG: acetylglutamate kinase [Firmicutes bacterium]|nr:acetylglutamate kinase [Bacillota bacterium]
MIAAATDKAAVLIEALPYIRKFYGATFVVKYGGSVMRDEGPRTSLMLDLILLKHIGINPVLVHGGGPEINSLLAEFGQKPEFVGGLRVTTPQTMEVVQMVLSGRVNKDIVSGLNRHGGKAVGVSGLDGPILEVEPVSAELGRVGRVIKVDPAPLKMLSREGYIPVVASLGLGPGGESYNINADLAAGELAVALQAAKLIILTDVEGVFTDEDGRPQLVSQLTPKSARALLESGAIKGGMIPKLESCLKAVESGVGRAHIIDGRRKHSLLLEIFTDTGIGTMLAQEEVEE